MANPWGSAGPPAVLNAKEEEQGKGKGLHTGDGQGRLNRKPCFSSEHPL